MKAIAIQGQGSGWPRLVAGRPSAVGPDALEVQAMYPEISSAAAYHKQTASAAHNYDLRGKCISVAYELSERAPSAVIYLGFFFCFSGRSIWK